MSSSHISDYEWITSTQLILIFLSTVQSLANKMDDVQILLRISHQHLEMLVGGLILHSALQLEGFQLFREILILNFVARLSSRPWAALSHSDHVMVHLIPPNRRRLKLSKPVVRNCKNFSGLPPIVWMIKQKL